MQQLLNEIHHKAWGKSWPTTTYAIHRSDIFPNETDAGESDEHMDINEDGNGFNDIPGESIFTCLLGVDLLQDAFQIPGGKLSVMVNLKEYEFLLDLLGRLERNIIVTGQPGTGKTMLILYILLYRLERQLVTAVQFDDDTYVVFKSNGVFLCRLTDPIDHRLMLPKGCWCLTDGNAYVVKPCKPFTRIGLRTFLMTSQNAGGYKKWATQIGAKTVITDLPRAVEVAAIAMVNGFEPRDAISMVRKWGPSTRTVLSILDDASGEHEQTRRVVSAAIDINKDPSKIVLHNIEQLPSGHGSALFFIKPIRSNDNHGYSTSEVIIPTMHLSEIFDYECDDLSALDRMRLHEFLVICFVTSLAGWQHKKNMHLQMMSVVRNRHEIFNETAKFHMHSAAGVLVGTASALRAAAHNRLSSFYWFPSVVRLPGIDSILVSGNNIYALQATIADTHDGPRIGLKSVWHTIGAEQARHFTWHFVVVTNNKSLADKYAKDFGTQLRDITLGCHPYVRVSVWACVLDSGVQPRDDGNGVGESPLAET